MSSGEIVRETKTVDYTQAPSLVPERAVDLDHLAGIAHGDSHIMHDMLRLFVLQIDMLLARMASEEPRVAAARAHTLAAAAQAVGAWNVAKRASAFESIAAGPGPISLGAAMNHLSRAAIEAQTDIETMISAGERRRG